MQVRRGSVLVITLVALFASVATASAQITTGNISGSVSDAQGGVIPGATVVLISESRGTQLAPVVTNEAGVYVFPNVTADIYTVEVSMDSFKTSRRTGVKVSGGDRVGVPAITLETGAITETVNVTAESLLVQSQSAERSFAVAQVQIENLPFNRQNFINAVQFTPGVILGGQGGAGTSGAAGATRLGGAGQNNIMMDGASAMDTGNNGQMLSMNTESIGEVKILTQGYQAEFGRSSGLQVTAVTKSGTNRFRGSVYDVERDSKWYSNSWVNKENKDPKPVVDEKDWGYSIGGPIGKPGAQNKLFFFYAHEYRPRNSPINNGNPIRLRVPTQAERNGDFSQTRDQNGNLFNLIRDHQSGLDCTATNTAGCFQAGGVLGRIPQDRLYTPGLAVLNRYPLPTMEQAPTTNWNYEIPAPQFENLIQQPAIRLDYQLSSNWRITGKYSGQRERKITRPGIIPGFSDAYTPYPFVTNYAITGNWTINPTTFLEGTYGFIRNELAGGNENGILMNEASNRVTSMPGFPTLYEDAGYVNPSYYAFEVMEAVKPPFWDGAKLNLPPTFAWGGRIGAAPPQQRYPGWLNINRTQDVAVSLTKVMGRHTFKGGFYNNHSFKAQNVGAGGIANLSFQGFVDFADDVNNALDTRFGYANAATGVFRQFLQASNFVEGSMIYDNTEFYFQDNWKVNNRLTLDYGMRFTHQGPQYDQFQQMSNFFPELWNNAQKQVLYVPGCSNGAVTCTGNTLNAMDPRNGQILTAPGTLNTQAAIATPIPGSGNPLNGIRQAGDGIADTGYTWPKLIVGPRVGVAYDLTGTQSTVLRAGGGLFYDRPDGNTVFSIPGNPPIATARDLRNGQLSQLGAGLSPSPVPALVTFQYEAQVPSSWQWNVGMQRVLPWSMAMDISYVGNHGYNRLGTFQGGTTVNLNSIDLGTAYLDQYQDKTKAPATIPGANALSANLLRPYPGLSNINQNTTDFKDTYHSIQASLNRRFRNGFSYSLNYTGQLSLTGNTGLQKRLTHNADGSISIRADQAEYEELNKNLGGRTHWLSSNAIWALPSVPQSFGHIAGAILNDWRLAGIFTFGSGEPYDLGFGYNGINQTNLTGSPDYNARVVFNGDPGSGCSDDRYKQFDVSVVRGPQFGSVGLESGRNILRDCSTKILDLAISRDIRLGGERTLQVRLDMYNALNTVIFDQANTNASFDNPTSMTLTNSQTLPDGSINPARLTPRTAGFGAANRALDLRRMQLMVRFSF
jgi:Carboxypeptidase regulatory-like domain